MCDCAANRHLVLCAFVIYPAFSKFIYTKMQPGLVCAFAVILIPLLDMRAQDLLESWPMGLMGLFQAQVERAKYASVLYELDHVVDIDLLFSVRLYKSGSANCQ